MLLAEVVAASAAVGATRARTAKAAALAAVLRAAEPEEIGPATAWLSGETLQGRLGTGWRTLAAQQGPAAAEATLTVAAVDTAFGELATTSGAGSTARRAELLGALFGAATAAEQEFLRRLLTGEMRQGALEGVMLEAVAAAAEVPAAAVRRAFMLSGRLPATARTALEGGVAALESVRLEVGRARPADAGLPRRLARRGAGRAGDRGQRRVQARRRAHPGAPRRRRGARVDPHPARDHRPACPSWSSSCAGCPAGRWCSTGRPSRWPTTAAPARSRRR